MQNDEVWCEEIKRQVLLNRPFIVCQVVPYTGIWKKLRNNSRDHIIHMNLKKDISHKDKLKGYIFARYLDLELTKYGVNNFKEAMAKAEYRYGLTDFDDLISKLEAKGWNIDFVFFTSQKNRFERVQ